MLIETVYCFFFNCLFPYCIIDSSYDCIVIIIVLLCILLYFALYSIKYLLLFIAANITITWGIHRGFFPSLYSITITWGIHRGFSLPFIVYKINSVVRYSSPFTFSLHYFKGSSAYRHGERWMAEIH